MPGLSPGSGLEPSVFYSLYQGGLVFDPEPRRLKASYVLLLAGRLGLRPDEILHAHEGWVDWERGELNIPDQDPCACPICVARARDAQSQQHSQPLGELLADEFWTPQTDKGARTIPFAWSDRLTALLAAFFANQPYLDCTPSEMESLVVKAAENVDQLSPQGIDFEALRSSSASFLADVGFEEERLADLLGVDTGAVGPFVRREGGYARNRLYNIANGSPPDICNEGENYPLVCQSTPLDGEPFDPEAALDHREQLLQQDSIRRVRNPRPEATPSSVSYKVPESVVPDYIADSAVKRDESGPVAIPFDQLTPREGSQKISKSAGDEETTSTTTPESDQSQESELDSDRGREGAVSETGVSTEAVLDPRELATDPIQVEFSTTLASSDIASGKPVTGRVLLGKDEVVLSHDDGGDYKDVPLDSITDIALDYTPSNVAEAFDSALGVAYRANGSKRIFILELPGKKQLDFSIQLFKQLLDDTPVVVTHPAREGGRVTDETPSETMLYVRSRKMEFGPEEGESTFGIRLSDIVHVERGKQTIEGETHKGLSVRHLRSDGQAVTTDIAPSDEEDLKLLERYVMRNYRERKERAKNLDLSADQKEVLVALYSTGSGMDITMILDKDSNELSNLLASLKDAGLVRTTGDGAKLTGMGQMIVSDKVDDVNV